MALDAAGRAGAKRAADAVMTGVVWHATSQGPDYWASFYSDPSAFARAPKPESNGPNRSPDGAEFRGEFEHMDGSTGWRFGLRPQWPEFSLDDFADETVPSDLGSFLAYETEE